MKRDMRVCEGCGARMKEHVGISDCAVIAVNYILKHYTGSVREKQVPKGCHRYMEQLVMGQKQ
jgi:hypothetical protein